jgi:aspartokinase
MRSSIDHAGINNVEQCLLICSGVPDKIGKLYDIVEALAAHSVSSDLILQNLPRDGNAIVGITIDVPSTVRMEQLVDDLRKSCRGVEVRSGYTKISVMGGFGGGTGSVMHKVLSSVSKAEIDIAMVSITGGRFELLFDEENGKKASVIIKGELIEELKDSVEGLEEI